MPGTDYRAAVAAILKHSGTTAYGLAKKAGMSQTAVLDVISGDRPTPRADTLDKLLRAAGLDWSFLNGFRVDESGEKPAAPVKKKKRAAE
jgi:transcriptional regulator with XRE-family HTH domain